MSSDDDILRPDRRCFLRVTGVSGVVVASAALLTACPAQTDDEGDDEQGGDEQGGDEQGGDEQDDGDEEGEDDR